MEDDVVEMVMKDVDPYLEKPFGQVLRKALKETGDGFKEAFMKLIPSEKEMRQIIHETIEKQGKGLTAEQKEVLIKQMESIYLGGQSIAEVFGLSEEELEVIYSFAFNYYKHGKYREARTIFTYLTKIKPNEPRFLFGAAASAHMLKDYFAASHFYFRCISVDWHNPVPWYHLGDCYHHMDREIEAGACYNAVIQRSKNKPAFEGLKKKAEILLEKVFEKSGAVQNAGK